MCFSATASFLAGGALGAAGGITLREAKTRERAPLAAVPLLFGLQQAVEGVVWVSSEMPRLQAAAAFVYVMFSHVLWPFYFPLAVMAIEPPGRRKGVLKGFLVFGIAVSLWLLSYIVREPVGATLTEFGVIYAVNAPDIPYGLAAYVFVTCFACFISSHKYVRVFGLALVGGLAITLWAYQQAFYSVWCFFAAILSMIIYVHLRLSSVYVNGLIKRANGMLAKHFPPKKT